MSRAILRITCWTESPLLSLRDIFSHVAPLNGRRQGCFRFCSLEERVVGWDDGFALSARYTHVARHGGLVVRAVDDEVVAFGFS
jgi:hypothetical protein